MSVSSSDRQPVVQGSSQSAAVEEAIEFYKAAFG